MTETILAEADRIAGECRSRDYGHPLDNHERIAAIWNVQLGPKLSAPITALDVAIMMVGLKLARLVNSPNHRDSLVDAAGYIKCADMIQTEQERRNAECDAELMATIASRRANREEIQGHHVTSTQATPATEPHTEISDGQQHNSSRSRSSGYVGKASRDTNKNTSRGTGETASEAVRDF